MIYLRMHACVFVSALCLYQGLFVHNVYSAVAVMTYRFWDSNPVLPNDEAPDEDVRLQIRAKALRVKSFAESVERQKSFSILLFTSIPLDHIWRHAQYAELQGALLQDLSVDKTNIFANAGRKFAAMLSAPVSESVLAPLFWQLAPIDCPDRHRELLREVLAVVAHQASHLWWRFIWRPCKFILSRGAALGLLARALVRKGVVWAPDKVGEALFGLPLPVAQTRRR